MAEEQVQRTGKQGELLRDRAVSIYISKTSVSAVARELEISIDWAAKIIGEELASARARRITNQELVLEAALQWQEAAVERLQGIWDRMPAKAKNYNTLERAHNRWLWLQGINHTKPSGASVQVNTQVNVHSEDLTGLTDEELRARLEEGEAPPVLLEGLEAG